MVVCVCVRSQLASEYHRDDRLTLDVPVSSWIGSNCGKWPPVMVLAGLTQIRQGDRVEDRLLFLDTTWE